MPRHPISQPPTIEPMVLALLLTAGPTILVIAALRFLPPTPTLRQRAAAVARTLTTMGLAAAVGRRPHPLIPRRR